MRPHISGKPHFFISFAAGLVLTSLFPARAFGQQNPAPNADLERRLEAMTALIEKLQSRVDVLEERLKASGDGAAATEKSEVSTRSFAPVATPSVTPITSVKQESSASPGALPAPPSAAPDLLHGTSVNFVMDGYYGYNFNNPVGRVNLLRAYDVSSNAFSLNQVGVILENAPDPARGKNFGLRVDLQFGQATETLQGNAANELRPDVWRNIFQAYGTWVAPVGHGLTVDFGKWASSLGIEGNYTKDQMNYSRSLWFDFLPFYHTGARLNYKFSDAIAANYWITNGTDQTEPFNSFKDQMFGLNLQPRKNIAWTLNYYLGQEHPDIAYVTTGNTTGLPTLQGTPFEPIPNPPKGKLHIVDSYATWQVSPRLSLALEGDYVIERLATTSAPAHTIGGAAYGRYQLTRRTAVAARAEYLSDRNGLYTGTSQLLRETTVTFEQRIADGFLLRQEWRRDSSTQPYFLTDMSGILKREQNTATLGIVWWFGAKSGLW